MIWFDQPETVCAEICAFDFKQAFHCFQWVYGMGFQAKPMMVKTELTALRRQLKEQNRHDAFCQF